MYKGFVNGATEWLSRIKLADFKTINTLGIQDENASNPYAKKYYLSMNEFLGTNSIVIEDTIPEEMKEFTRLFENQYDSIKEKLIDEDGNPISQEEYLEMLLHWLGREKIHMKI